MSADDCHEWGDFDLNSLLNFRYQEVDTGDLAGSQTQRPMQSTFSQWMGIQQHISPEEASRVYQEQSTDGANVSNESILLLGCGNSKLGEQLLVNSFQGPVVQLDVSSKVIQIMTQRYQKYLREAAVKRMHFVVDDAATGLTALEHESVGGGVVDKGLLDVLHCSMGKMESNDTTNTSTESDGDSQHPIQTIVESVHRVLQPSRPFLFFSRTGPEYMLKRIFGQDSTNQIRRNWSDVNVVHLVDLNVLMYRFIKASENDLQEEHGKGIANVRVTTRAFRKKMKETKK